INSNTRNRYSSRQVAGSSKTKRDTNPNSAPKDIDSATNGNGGTTKTNGTSTKVSDRKTEYE
ncbi:hypothetical protein EBV26_16735, partial [bacterium]|nr:hypothetical protein [bacterium]